jgi:hypothetical protein
LGITQLLCSPRKMSVNTARGWVLIKHIALSHGHTQKFAYDYFFPSAFDSPWIFPAFLEPY